MDEQVASALCPNCLDPVPESDNPFCPNCGAPIGASAVLDPINIIQTEGYIFRRGADRPNLVIVLGVWLFFLPTLILGINSLFTAGRELPSVLLVTLVCCALPIVILYRTTTKYVRSKKAYGEPDDEEDHWELESE